MLLVTIPYHQRPSVTIILDGPHLVCLYESSNDYATQQKLLPFCKWLNLTHQDTFIHGPFDFSTANGHKTWCHISQPDWDILKAYCDMFHNPLRHKIRLFANNWESFGLKRVWKVQTLKFFFCLPYPLIAVRLLTVWSKISRNFFK